MLGFLLITLAATLVFILCCYIIAYKVIEIYGYDTTPDIERFSNVTDLEGFYGAVAFIAYTVAWSIDSLFTTAKELAKYDIAAEQRDEMAALRRLHAALPSPKDILKEVKAPRVLLELRSGLLKNALDIITKSLVLPELTPENLEREKAFYSQDLKALYSGILTEAFEKLFSRLPAYMSEPGVFHSTLPIAVSNPAPIREFLEAFKDKPVFKTVQVAHERAISFIVNSKEEYGTTSYNLSLLYGTPFTALEEATVPIAIPLAHRFEGMWIIAPPGRGKTTLLSRLFAADLDEVKAGKASIILMDSKGDLIDHARRLARFAPGGDLEGKLVLIEPTSNLAINPLDIGASAGHTIALLEYLFAGILDTATTPLQSTLLRSVLLAMQSIPNATFATFRQLLVEGWKPFEQYIRTLHPEDQDFFMKPMADGKSEFDGKTYKETKDQLLWRIRDLTTKVPLLRDMFQAPHTRIDIGKEMDAGKVIIIDNSVATLSAGSEFFSRFFVALILSAAQQRAGRTESNKLPCYFYIDECDTVIARDLKIAEIIQRCRSQKIGLVLAHQTLRQIDLPKVQAALSDCAVRMANSDREAKELSHDMRIDEEHLRQLKKGRFALFMRDLTPKALVVDVPNEPVSSWPKMSEAQFREIQRQMAERYSFTPTAVPRPAPSSAAQRQDAPEPGPPPPPPPPEGPTIPAEDTTPQKWE